MLLDVSERPGGAILTKHSTKYKPFQLTTDEVYTFLEPYREGITRSQISSKTLAYRIKQHDILTYVDSPREEQSRVQFIFRS